MENLIKEYIEILQKDTNASVRFWELEERIFKDRKYTGVSAEMSRSKMLDNIICGYMKKQFQLRIYRNAAKI